MAYMVLQILASRFQSFCFRLFHGVSKATIKNSLSLLPIYHSDFGAQTVCFGFGNQLPKHMKGLSIAGGGGIKNIFANHLCLNNSKLYGPKHTVLLRDQEDAELPTRYELKTMLLKRLDSEA